MKGGEISMLNKAEIKTQYSIKLQVLRTTKSFLPQSHFAASKRLLSLTVKF